MGFWDAARRAYYGAVEPQQVAEELVGRPWTPSVGAISASATTRLDFRDAFNGLGRLYRLERVSVVNNDTVDVKVRPNADLLREVIVGAGGGSATVDHGAVEYLEVENLSATTAVTTGKVLVYGEAFKRTPEGGPLGA